LITIPLLPFTPRTRTRTRYAYCTIREAKLGFKTKLELEANITTDTGSNMEDIVNLDDEMDFNPFRDSEDIIDINMD
jgi:hypothetical protein